MTTTETVSQTQDARLVPLSTADKLRQDAVQAAQVRALSNHPDVIALRVEKVRSFVDLLVWVGIFLGLAFTMVNVQTFAAAGARPWSLPWLAAWLLDPMVSLVLVAVLRAEQITARYQVLDGMVWAHRTKWFAFLATYVMNTWQSWTHLDVAGVVLHSVPPVLVFLAAETAPALRDRLTEAVTRAAAPAFTGARLEAPPEAVHEPAPEPVQPRESALVHDIVPEPAAKPVRRAPRKAKAPAKPARKLRADYLAEARAAWAPGIAITPAWVREVCPGISRGTSKNVADDLTADTSPAPSVSAIPTTESSREAAAVRREEAAA